MNDLTFNEDRLLKPKEAATFLKVSPSTMARWRHEGIGPQFFKLPSGSILYSLKRLVDFVNTCR